ncbi:hypothetical protein L1987_16545 [Smallanthus sonchifolius]|uniref:Uncharacterized protein n=1 Tax=Smallanthus sonchifolius TaxID=185202 RepID=A0ACB9J965_9ASTR|nr:hypothetical protein L1987_16545 [Smallanthus sonchifolius]
MRPETAILSQNVVFSSSSFICWYMQESTCEMKRSIESRDKKIAMLSEKINAHLLSLDSIRKEAYSVKQVVDNAQRVVDEKEEALRSEVGMLEVSFKIIQDTMTCMDEEDRVAYSLILANQEKNETEKDREDGRKPNMLITELSCEMCASLSDKGQGRALWFCVIICYNDLSKFLEMDTIHHSTFSPSSSVHSESQPAANASNVPAAEDKEHLDNAISVKGNNIFSNA